MSSAQKRGEVEWRLIRVQEPGKRRLEQRSPAFAVMVSGPHTSSPDEGRIEEDCGDAGFQK